MCDEFCDRYGVCTTWLNYGSLIFAIPENWLPSLFGSEQIQNNIKTRLDKLHNSNINISKTIYLVFIANPNQLSGTCQYWSRILEVELDYDTYLKKIEWLLLYYFD